MKCQYKNIGSSILSLVFVFLFLILIISLISFYYSNQADNIDIDDKNVDFWLHSSSACHVGEECVFFVFIRNSEPCDLNQVEVSLSFPSSFSLDSDVSGYEKDLTNRYIWRWGEIKSKTLQEIRIKGVFSGEADYDSLVEGSLYFRLEGFSSEFQDYFSDHLQVEPFPFNINLKIPALSYNWGELLPLALVYENNSDKEIKNLKINISLDKSQYFDLNDLEQNFWYYYLSQDYQTSLPYLKSRQPSDLILKGWDSRLISNLAKIKPEDQGAIVFYLPLVSVSQAQENRFIQAESEMQVLVSGDFKDYEGIIAQSPKINLKIATDLKLNVKLGYYDYIGQELKRGELPFLGINQKTLYRVIWNLENGSNAVQNVVVKTKLPAYVEWTGQSENTEGTLSYNELNREIIWEIPELLPYQGFYPSPSLEANFEIAVIPKLEDADSKIILTKDIFLTANDKFTNTPLMQEVDSLSTNLVPLP
ncbi:hypothetical protein J7L24_02220 [bacterium]|nr:hypothetical protein [bacterium]